tara:strand:+ start:252 stop:506 length:255 start_codon:yes stop_codon:yes gene_type:complete
LAGKWRKITVRDVISGASENFGFWMVSEAADIILNLTATKKGIHGDSNGYEQLDLMCKFMELESKDEVLRFKKGIPLVNVPTWK